MDAIIGKLELQMRDAAERLDFEQAAALRDKLVSVRKIVQEQKVFSISGGDQDIVGFAASNTDTCIQVFFIRDGKLLGRRHFIVQGSGEAELAETASSFLKQFYGTADMIPPEIITGADVEDRELIEDWLGSRRGRRVHVRVPKRGEKVRMVEMVAKNARIELERFNEEMRKADGVQKGLKELAGMLGLDEPPERIEAYDISNTGSSEIVASMAVFREQDAGEGIQAIQDTVHRYAERLRKHAGSTVQEIKHAIKEKSIRGPWPGKKAPGSSANCWPDRGRRGIGHVNAAGQVMKDLDVDIPICGMVKDDSTGPAGWWCQEGNRPVRESRCA